MSRHRKADNSNAYELVAERGSNEKLEALGRRMVPMMQTNERINLTPPDRNKGQPVKGASLLL